VVFRVIFSEFVVGVDTGDFDLALTYITGASVTSISGSGDTYLVTASTGSGDGSLRLEFVDDDSVRDAVNLMPGGAGASNGNFTSGETYTIVKNDVPIITGQYPLSIDQDTSLTWTDILDHLIVSDPDNSYPYDFSLTVQDGSNYSVSGQTVIPSASYYGSLTVPVRVNDGAADSGWYSLLVTVNPVSDNPFQVYLPLSVR
jgi:hypothetical protein